MKSILIVTHNMRGGGCERVISILANRYCASGIRVTLCTEYSGPCFYKLDPAIERIELSKKETTGKFDVPVIYGRLRRIVKEKKPDIVLAMPEKVNVWTVLFLMGTDVPVAVSERNDPRRHPENRLKRLLRRIVYPMCDGFIFQTETQRDFFPASIRERGIVLDNPVELPPLPSGQNDRTRHLVLSAGRLEPQKNFSLLIEAFAALSDRYPDWDLAIYGEGREREALLSLISSRGLENRIALPGQTDALSEKIESSDLFVLSSDFEGMPNVLIEAMCLGRPAIASDCPCGGPSALIEDGKNGLLFPVGNRQALTDKMELLLSDGNLRKAIGEQALSLRSRLNATTVTEKWSDYLDGILKKQNRR